MSVQNREQLTPNDSEKISDRKFTPEIYRRRLVELGLAEADSQGRMLSDSVVDDAEQAYSEAHTGKEYRDWQKVIEKVAKLFIDSYEKVKVEDIETAWENDRSVYEIVSLEERKDAQSRMANVDTEREYRHLITQGLRDDIYTKLSSLSTSEIYLLGRLARGRTEGLQISNGHSLSSPELALINMDSGDESTNKKRSIDHSRILGEVFDVEVFDHSVLGSENHDDARDIVSWGSQPNMTDVVACLIKKNGNRLPDINRVGITTQKLAMIHEDFRRKAEDLEYSTSESHRKIKNVKDLGTKMTGKFRGKLR